MSQRIAGYGDDVGHLEVTAQKMATALQRIGVTAALAQPDTALPAFAADALATFKRGATPKSGDLAAATRMAARGSPDWSRASALAAGTTRPTGFGVSARFGVRADQMQTGGGVADPTRVKDASIDLRRTVRHLNAAANAVISVDGHPYNVDFLDEDANIMYASREDQGDAIARLRARVLEQVDEMRDLAHNVAHGSIHDGDVAAMGDRDIGNRSSSLWNYDRLEAIKRFTALSYDELYMVVGIMSLPPTPLVLARFAEQGLQLIGARVERWNERYQSNSMLLMKRGGSTVQTIISPMNIHASAQGIVGITNFTAGMDLGLRWLSQTGITEFVGLFPRHVDGGVDARFIPSLGAAIDMISTPDVQPPPHTCFLITYPVTESQHEYSCNIFGSEEVYDRERTYKQPSFALRKCSGHVTLRALLGHGVCDSADSQLANINPFIQGGGFEGGICPIVERGVTYYYNGTKGDYSNGMQGTGPLAAFYLNVDNVAAELFNGGRTAAPGQAPAFITPIRTY